MRVIWLRRWLLPAAQWLFMVMLALEALNASALNLSEGTGKLALGTEITKIYVIPLGLEGKPATQSINKLLSEGFRCNLEPYSTIVTRERPLSDCIKKQSGFGALCDDLSVVLRFPHQEKKLSRAELMERLVDIKVYAATAFCPYKSPSRSEYLAARHIGTENLEKQVQAFDLVGNARTAYDKLMEDGYHCGFELDPTTQKPTNRPKLICTKWPSQIEYCYEAKLVADVQWGDRPIEAVELLGELKTARVLKVQSSCEVPVMPAAKDAGS